MPGPKYAVGQRVEVLTFDFETATFPDVWMSGTVTMASPMDDARWDVVVTCDNGNSFRQVVGKHGELGRTKRIRAL